MDFESIVSASSTTPARPPKCRATGRLHSRPVEAVRRSFRAAAAATCLVIASAGCGPDAATASDGGPVLRVAVLQFSDLEDPVELVSSSALAVDLAIEQAEARGELSADSSLWFIETANEDPEVVEDEARELAADPSVVAAVVTPFVNAPDAERAFVDAGVPVFSFSALGGVPGSALWRRVVPTAAAEAATIADLTGSDRCVAAQTALAPPVQGIDVGSEPEGTAHRVREEACSGVAWLGETDGAIALAVALGDAGGSVPLVVSAAARADRLASEGYPDVQGVAAVVPCRSVDVAVEIEARRFVHAYQAAHGVPPGLCAAEGFGLGRWLIDHGSRSAIAQAFEVGASVETPVGPLELGHDEAVSPVVDRVIGVRWLPQAES
jgi:hypothetical protein